MQNETILLWIDTRKTDQQMELTVKVIREPDNEFKGCDAGVPGDSRITVKLTAPDGSLREMSGCLETDGTVSFACPDVELWSPEHPVLYRAYVTLEGHGGLLAEREQSVGFRTLAREGQKVLWNGCALKLKGVCYREASGAPVRKDLELFREANVNFLRSIYGPFSEEFLQLCDEMGFLTEDTAPFYEIGQSGPMIQDAPHCREQFTQAARQMLSVGSHVSVLIWSLGDDCVWGANFRHMAQMIRDVDAIRPMTFHLPMSIPEEDWQPDIWPVHYIDYRQPFDVCYDQMVIFHTPGADNEIGYMTGEVDYGLPVLHEVWAPVACHNRSEIAKNSYIRDFWGESIRRFAKKSLETEGCLGGAVLAGVDEDGSFAGMGNYAWGILDRAHHPKPEYAHLKEAYALSGSEASIERNASHLDDAVECDAAQKSGLCLERTAEGNRRCPDYTMDACASDPLSIDETEEELTVRNHQLCYIFSKETCLLESAYVSGRQILAGGPYLNSTGLILGDWKGRGIEMAQQGEVETPTPFGRRISRPKDEDATRRGQGASSNERNASHLDDAVVRVIIRGTYTDVLEIAFYLTIWPDGRLDTEYEVERLYRHMPHTVKAEIGVATGGLNEKGAGYLLAPGVTVCEAGKMDDAYVHLEEAPFYTPEAMVDDRDARMRFDGDWYRMDDGCGDYRGTETLSARAGDTMTLAFSGTGIRLYGPLDINYGICDIYLDGELLSEGVSQYPDKVDFPGMSRGYEKQYNHLLAEAHGLPEGLHELLVRVKGEKEPGAQNTYTAIDYAVLEGAGYPDGTLLNVNQDYNFSRMVRGCYRRPKVELIPGVREGFSMRMNGGGTLSCEIVENHVLRVPFGRRQGASSIERNASHLDDATDAGNADLKNRQEEQKA